MFPGYAFFFFFLLTFFIYFLISPHVEGSSRLLKNPYLENIVSKFSLISSLDILGNVIWGRSQFYSSNTDVRRKKSKRKGKGNIHLAGGTTQKKSSLVLVSAGLSTSASVLGLYARTHGM